MSEYTVVSLEINDEAVLKDSLSEMGFRFTVHQEPVALTQGDGCGGCRRESRTQQKAHIVVHREKALPYGFLRKADGTFDLIKRGMPKDFLKTLKQTYAKHKVIKQAKRMGFTLASQKSTDGKIKLKLTRIG